MHACHSTRPPRSHHTCAVAQVRQLRSRIAQHDVYDVPAWEAVFEELKGMPPSEEARAVYEAVAAAFPTKVRRVTTRAG